MNKKLNNFIPATYKFFLVLFRNKIFLSLGFVNIMVIGTLFFFGAVLRERAFFSVLISSLFAGSIISFGLYYFTTITMLYQRTNKWNLYLPYLAGISLAVLVTVILGTFSVIGGLNNTGTFFLSDRHLFFLIMPCSTVAMFVGVSLATRITMIWENEETQLRRDQNAQEKKIS